MNNQQNALLNNFYMHQQSRIPFHQNNLLKNNPALVANLQNQKSIQMQQMQQMQKMQQMKLMQMQQHMQKMKRAQELKKIEKQKIDSLKNFDKLDKSDITKAIIQPECSKLTKKEIEDIQINYDDMINRYGTEESYKAYLQKIWNKRTNQPYKNILKNEDYKKNFKNEKDLIVHTVTNLDKDEEQLEYEFNQKNDDIEKHNDELKIIYSTSKEAENKKKFEYNNVYKFRMKYNPKDHQDKKQDKIDYYKREQKKLDKGNRKFNEVIEQLVNSSVFDKDQLANLGITTKDDEVNVDIDKIEQIDKEMKEKYGEEYESLMKDLQNDENEEQKLDKIEEDRKKRKQKHNNTVHKSDTKSRIKPDIETESIKENVDTKPQKKKAKVYIRKKAHN